MRKKLKKQLNPKTRDWHRWFAWHPVIVGQWHLVWLEHIERRYEYDQWNYQFKPEEYV